VRLGVAGGLLALICWGAQHTVLADWARMHFLARAAALGGTIAIAAAVFFAAAWALGIEELRDLGAVVKRRLARRAA
jgi:putative peptidoglycan lipid II flippase